MSGANLTRRTVDGVTLLGDWGRPGGVTFAFTERTGGVSEGAYASLNLGASCGDDPAAVAANRLRAVEALGAGACAERLVNPRQVHGDHVVVVRTAEGPAFEAARNEAREGADAVVCLAADVPVLLCFADCVPVVLAAPGAFAVAHSGWKGTLARISGKALAVLCEEAACSPADVCAYIGPHIGVEDYEVSEELLATFKKAFGHGVRGEGRTLDLEFAVKAALLEGGVREDAIACVAQSTASATDRFFSYRAFGGTCGRHGALAFIADDKAKEA